jgi:hypothetical protein
LEPRELVDPGEDLAFEAQRQNQQKLLLDWPVYQHLG